MKEDFEEIFNKWKEELENNSSTISSNSIQFQKSEHFQKIVDLGKDALPYIIEKLDEGYFILNNALPKITGLSITDLQEHPSPMSEQDISNLWISWWKKNQNIEKIVRG